MNGEWMPSLLQFWDPGAPLPASPHDRTTLNVCIALFLAVEDLLLALHTTTSNQCHPCHWSSLHFLFLIRLYFLWLLSFFLYASAFLEKRLKLHCHFQPQESCTAGPSTGLPVVVLGSPSLCICSLGTGAAWHCTHSSSKVQKANRDCAHCPGLNT